MERGRDCLSLWVIEIFILIVKNNMGEISLSCLPKHSWNPPLSIYSAKWDLTVSSLFRSLVA